MLCVDSLVAIPARCLCSLTNASATFADDLGALEARAEANVRLAPTIPWTLPSTAPNSGAIPNPSPNPPPLTV